MAEGGEPVMTTTPEEPSTHEHRTMYIVAAIVLVVLMVIGLITYRGNKSTREAEDKADQFIAALQKAGAQRIPSQEQVVGVFGNDGGAACADPTKALAKSTFFRLLSNGAAGPGERPIIADRKVVRGQLLVIEVYCPDQLPAFTQFVDKLKTDDTVEG
jgi:hypothetical protein